MTELCELRVIEEYANLLFRPTEGERLGDSVRKIELRTDDPKFQRVGELQQEVRERFNRSFFHGWDLRYKYTHRELEAADLLRVRIKTAFEPEGERCGTVYDESIACPSCGAGAKQVS